MKIHFIGIGGIGISALARIFQNQGHEISGSDANQSALTDDLKAIGIIFFAEHKAENLANDVEKVIYTEAIPKNNPELQKAKQLGIEFLTYFQALGEFSQNYRVIAIAGTHGKTTTTAMTALSLIEGKIDPNVIIGTKVEEFGKQNVRMGKSNFLVVEACEYRESFLNLKPEILVITNVEAEHLDYYKTEENYLKAFRKLCQKIPKHGVIVIVEGDQNAEKVTEGVEARVLKLRIADDELEITNYELRITNNESEAKKVPIAVSCETQCSEEGDTGGVKPQVLDNLSLTSKQNIQVQLLSLHSTEFRRGFSTKLPILQVPGQHYKIDAGLALVVGLLLGIETEKLQKALGNFKGTWRRFEKKGEKNGIVVIDDYAHHPTEIQATLKGAREMFGNQKIVCVFQPHQYSRTRLLFKDFVQSFGDCDEVIIPNIYKVRDTEEDVKSVSAEKLVEAINQHSQNAIFGDGFENTVEILKSKMQAKNVLITMGAGPVHEIGESFLKKTEK